MVNIQLLNFTLLLLLLGVVYARDHLNVTEKRSIETVATIADGGTNSGTALVGGKLMYSSSTPAIVEASSIYATIDTLKVGQNGVSNSLSSTTKFNLHGTTASQSTGPSFSAYGSSDAYPLLQILSYQHDGVYIGMDGYFGSDGFWHSSSSTGSYLLMKSGGKFVIKYGTASAGGLITWNQAAEIGNDGILVLAQGVKLPTSGGTPATLKHNEYLSTTVSIGGAFSNSSVPVAVSRVGNSVTMTISAFTGTATSATSLDFNVWSTFPDTLKPKGEKGAWTIPTHDTFSSPSGMITYTYDNSYNSGCDCFLNLAKFSITAPGGGLFSTGSGRGIPSDVTIQYVKD